MTKYKINDNNSTTGSQVTLTSYMIGESPETEDQCNYQHKKCKGTILDLPQEKYTEGRQMKPTVTEWLKERARKTFTKKLLYKRIPILKWLPEYNLNFAVADLVAGITVGLTVIPQGIAYSNVAGLPPQIGKR